MWYDLFRDRAIVNFGNESFGVTFTHWGRRGRSWSFRWDNVITIDAVLIETACFEFRYVFQSSAGQSNFVSDDMENWSAFEDAIRRRFPDFNWSNVEATKRYENRNTAFNCWKRS